MRLIFLLLWTLILDGNYSIAQDNYFYMGGQDYSSGKHENCFKKYLKKDYIYDEDSIRLDSSHIKFIIFSQLDFNGSKDLWVLQTNRKTKVNYNLVTNQNKNDVIITEPIFLGSVDNSGIIYFPKIQPYGDTLIVVFIGKQFQKVMLFNNWDAMIFDGNKLFFDIETLDLYTKSVNSDIVFKFNRKLKKIVKLKRLPSDDNIKSYEFTEGEKL